MTSGKRAIGPDSNAANAQELDDEDLDTAVGGGQFTTAARDLASKTSASQTLDLDQGHTPDIITAPGTNGGPR